MTRHLRPRAFTLIELLVAIGLMVLLMGSVSMIFFGSSEVFQTERARIQIASNARTSLDMLSRDLAGCLPIDSRSQAFVMWNVRGRAGDNGETVVPNPSSTLPDGAADAIQFWSMTSFRGVMSVVHVTYYVDVSRDPEIMQDAGTATGVRSGRKLLVLRRIARRQVGSSWETDDADLCEYVLSFNLEALVDPDDAGPQVPRFVQLDEGPFRSAPLFAPPGNPYDSTSLDWWSRYAHPALNPITDIPPLTPSDPVLSTALHALYPIGGTNPPRAVANSIKPPMAIRVTMRVVDGGAEKQERLISRVLWTPIQ